jgi:V8-like Glu-specific endopeptidase
VAYIETEITFDEHQLKSVKIIRSVQNQFSKAKMKPNIRSGDIPERTEPEFVSPSSEEYMCGVRDEYQHVELYDGSLGVTKEFVMSYQSAVGQLQWNGNLEENYSNPGNVSDIRWGSGTLISNDLFLTAGHCFYDRPTGWEVPLSNTTNQPITPQEIAKNIHINFNHQYDPSGNLRQSKRFAILELLEYQYNYQNGLDYAIVRLDGNPGELYGYIKTASFNPRVGDQICIIGHPKGDPKKIHAGNVTYVNDDRIGYNEIDTYSGSSGSGIIHYPSGKIIGVHTNGGCGSHVGYNYGFQLNSLRAQSPILQDLID